MKTTHSSDGVVVRVESGVAWVRAAARQQACGACERKAGCAVAGTGELLDGATAGQLLCLPNTIHARPGDRVSIEIDDGEVWRAAWRAYLRPLLLALFLALVLKAVSGSDLLAALGVLLGLLGGFFLLQRKGLDSPRHTPILSIKFRHPSAHFITRS
jgi:positive regulator of sigma E activity